MNSRVNCAEVLPDLIASVGGSVHLPGADDYAHARSTLNGAANRRPAVVVKCRNADEVRLAVRAARLRNFPLSVRGAGHDWVSRARGHEGLVIDLSAMRRVNVDPITRIATVEGGATAADVIGAARQHGLVAVTGNFGAVGMAGLTLGGGYGPLTPKFGLALDNLVNADVVLEDGSLVTSDCTTNGELFWALRGGGGNFGVVVSMRIRLHALSEMLAGSIVFPWSEAQTILPAYCELMSRAPDELSVLGGIFPTRDGRPALFLAPAWCGDPAGGQPVIAAVRALGSPVFSSIGMMSYADILARFDAYLATSRRYAVQTRWLADLSSDAVAALIEAANTRSSVTSIITLQHFHGAGTRITTASTAFGLRRRHFMVEIAASWDPAAGDDGAAHRQWARSLSASLEPSAIPGGYASLLATDAYERIDAAYGCNALRLRRLKKRFDPDGVFCAAIPLPLDTQGSQHDFE
jgi:FAD/FMN-containing dehydrogenase